MVGIEGGVIGIFSYKVHKVPKVLRVPRVLGVPEYIKVRNAQGSDRVKVRV